MPPQRRKKGKKRLQKGSFLNRYDFAYAATSQTFKNLDKTVPALIQNLKGELNDVLQQRIYQVIKEGGAQLKEVGPQLLKGAIEDAYKTLFRLLGNCSQKIVLSNNFSDSSSISRLLK